jgi:3-oxoacyl-[acyl-carrier protein] reductase
MRALDLTGKVALVTGSSRGIGRAIAQRLLEAGASVVLNAHAETPELAATQDALAKSFPGKVSAAAADVGKAEDAQKLARFVFDAHKRLDILVNNAGRLGDGLIGMIPAQTIEETLQANLASVLYMTQAAARLMARGKKGSIINLSSIMGTRGCSGQMVYGAAKAGVIGATLSAAKELAPQGIRVNAIAPGFIRTAMTENLCEDVKARRIASIALGRIGEPEDIADVALFLASDLSAYVTGQVIGVDGGMVL